MSNRIWITEKFLFFFLFFFIIPQILVYLCTRSWVWQDKNFDPLTQPFLLGMSGIQEVMCLGGGIPCPHISGSCGLTVNSTQVFNIIFLYVCWRFFTLTKNRDQCLMFTTVLSLSEIMKQENACLHQSKKSCTPLQILSLKLDWN